VIGDENPLGVTAGTAEKRQNRRNTDLRRPRQFFIAIGTRRANRTGGS